VLLRIRNNFIRYNALHPRDPWLGICYISGAVYEQSSVPEVASDDDSHEQHG
jgi:hypothetical protein